MGDESEKRFHSIMDKLFHAPKSRPRSKSTSSSKNNPLNPTHSSSRGSIFRFQNSTVAADKLLQQAPLCRPWAREDLLKRLATFKSMTWFGKPMVVNAVNCARRGWVNVDVDIIACESCGARLLFSTPASWSRQQIEKAALVFSLKLESGHKLLCPWIDNACDENLSKFPPMQAPALVDRYRERSSALLQLVALPVISFSVIDTMKSPQLDNFIRESFTLECGDGPAETFRPAYLGNEFEGVSANLYYQALKLISLCGWEPRSLPYMVDWTNRSKQSSKDANGEDVHVYSASMKGIMEANEFSNTSSDEQCDPSSVVLDCKLCGASVGLWAFSTVSRPVELFRLVGEVSGKDESESSGPPQIQSSIDNRRDTASNNGASSKDISNINVTIAGGPPPTKQNFKAKISLPVIGQNLRARFYSHFNFKDRVSHYTPSDSMIGSTLQNKNDRANDTDDRQEEAEVTRMLKRKRDSMSDDQLPSNNNAIIVKGYTLASPNSLDNGNETAYRLSHKAGVHDAATMGDIVESTPEVAHQLSQNDNLSQNGENTVQVAEETEFSTRDDEVTTNGSPMIVTANNCSHEESSADINYDHSPKIDQREGNCAVQSTSRAQINSLEVTTKALVSTEVARNPAKKLNQQPLHREMEFDAIRQHRHFCPWISSTDGAVPGWQQTLSAIQRQKERSCPSPMESPSTTSMIEVDDPIASVRKLFMSSSPKRVKSAQRQD